MNPLDELVFSPAKMAPLLPSDSTSIAAFKVGGETAGRSAIPIVNFSGPWIITHSRSSVTAKGWAELYREWAARGWLLDGPTKAATSEFSGAAPLRIYQQSLCTPLHIDELRAANLVEIVCRSATDSIWGWPPEVEQTSLLIAWLTAVRCVIGPTKPLGVGLRAGVQLSDIQIALDAQVEFLVIHQIDSVSSLIDSIAQIRTLLQHRVIEMPLLVRTNSSRVDDLIKLLALGASAVTVDAYLADLWRPESSSASTFLPVKLDSTSERQNQALAQRLRDLEFKLSETMRLVSATNLSQLGTALRGITTSTAQLGKVPHVLTT